MIDGLPDPSNPEEAIPWIRDNLRDGWTPNSDAVRTLLAKYDRMKLELDHAYAVMERMADLIRQQATATNAALVGTLTRGELAAIQDETRAIAKEMRGG